MSKDNKADPKVSIPLSRYNALMDAERQLEIFINDRPKVLWGKISHSLINFFS